MRFLTFNILLAAIAVIAAMPGNIENEPQYIYDVDVQGHENIADRNSRQYGYGNYGNYRGNYDSFGGSYGGYRRSYGRYRNSNSVHRGGLNNFGGYSAGYGGFGGSPGSYYR